MGGATAEGEGETMSMATLQVGAPGAPTNGVVERDWAQDLVYMYSDVALCREELAARRPAPTTLDSALFALTELAEYAEASRLRVNGDYIRNNARQFDARRELAQTGEMVLTALWAIDTEPRIQDAGAVMIGSIAYRLGMALVAWGKGQRHVADNALARAAEDWRDLALLVGEDPERLIADELARIRAKFAPAAVGVGESKMDDDIDEDVRIEMVASLAEIIRSASKEMRP